MYSVFFVNTPLNHKTQGEEREETRVPKEGDTLEERISKCSQITRLAKRGGQSDFKRGRGSSGMLLEWLIRGMFEEIKCRCSYE